MRPDLGVLFTRPYWLDEWHAVLVANRPSLAAVFSDLRQGADFGPPLLHVTLWLLRIATGGGPLEPWVARAFTIACTGAALCFVYLTLRHRFDRAPSAAGALAIATQGIVVAYAFDVRFYAPWLACASGFAWALSLDEARERSARRDVAIATFAVLLCTVHWFGVVTLGLMCAAAAFAPGRAWRERVRRVAPAAAGVAALLVCLPLLVGQRGAIVEKTWIAPLSAEQMGELATVYWLAPLPLLALALVLAAWLRPATRDALRSAVVDAARAPGGSLAALAALALMPVAMTLVSLRQSAMLPRYSFPAFLAWAPLVALSVGTLPRAARGAAAALLGLGVVVALGGQVGTQRYVASVVARDRLLLREACRGGDAVAFTTRLQMYYHTDAIRERCPQAAMLLLPDSTLARLFRGNSATYRVENEFARLHQRLYGFPRVVSPAELDSLAHFVVMSDPAYLPRDAQGRELFSGTVFPRHAVTPLNGDGALYRRVR